MKFSSIDTREYRLLIQFILAKKIHVLNFKDQPTLTQSGRLSRAASNTLSEDDPYLAQLDDENDGEEGDEDYDLDKASSQSEDEGDFSDGDAQMAATDEDEDYEDDKPTKRKREDSEDGGTPRKPRAPRGEA